jgi:hypothetical protein
MRMPLGYQLVCGLRTLFFLPRDIISTFTGTIVERFQGYSVRLQAALFSEGAVFVQLPWIILLAFFR